MKTKHIEKFIEDAVAGGWRWKYYPPEKPEFDLGGANSEGVVATWKHNRSSFFLDINSAVLDPEAWKAVSKTRDWSPLQRTHGFLTTEEWHCQKFISKLFEGKTINEALEAINNSN